MAKKPSPNKAHATYSASGAARWLGCPGSIKLSESAPEQPESPYAAEGTEAHTCLEFILKNGMKKPDAVKRLALKKYSADMVNHAIAAAEWIWGYAPEGSEILCETVVDSSPFCGEGQFGTVDCAVVDEFSTLTVIDYKYGFNLVDPAGDNGLGNPQLVYYALGISHQYDHNFEKVSLVVIQPRAYTESGETVRIHTMSVDELLLWGDTFKNGVYLSEQPEAPLAAGTWCKYCPATVICPAIKDRSMEAAKIAFSDELGLIRVPDPKLIQVPNLSTILNACDRLEDWIEKVREHAVHVLRRGEHIEGFKLVDKRSTRRWKDEAKVAKAAAAEFGEVAFSEPELLSPAQLEKTVKKHLGINADRFAKWMAKNTTNESSGTTLVRDTDKRPAVNSIATIFTEVDTYE